MSLAKQQSTSQSTCKFGKLTKQQVDQMASRQSVIDKAEYHLKKSPCKYGKLINLQVD
jgi:hypothetical protein